MKLKHFGLYNIHSGWYLVKFSTRGSTKQMSLTSLALEPVDKSECIYLKPGGPYKVSGTSWDDLTIEAKPQRECAVLKLNPPGERYHK